jgi:hypothetical protein
MENLTELSELSERVLEIDSYGPADSASHGNAAFIEQCGRRSAVLRALALRSWLASMRSKARLRDCQWIEGEPTMDDACKCGAPTVNGTYCAEHVALCTVPSSQAKPARVG